MFTSVKEVPGGLRAFWLGGAMQVLVVSEVAAALNFFQRIGGWD
jgi:hypothetical protein